uniref:trypsin n=1 Tax=Seriola dumerili TaxID=41447 RepID=A0A3B4VI55_SERDU
MADIDYADYTTDAPDILFDENDWLFDLLEESSKWPWKTVRNCVSILLFRSIQSFTFTLFCLFQMFVTQTLVTMVAHAKLNQMNNSNARVLHLTEARGVKKVVRNICENVKCGHGDCVINLNKSPYYECKCKPPFQGPNCKSSSPCEPNPCQNGGSCVKGNRRFRCVCPDGYTGIFCKTASSDCYVENGETYRGDVSTTEQGVECLDWHSNFIMGNNTFNNIVVSLFSLQFRNPDGDDKPWCFFKKQKQLGWDYCKVKKCSEVKPQPDPSQFSQCGISQPSRTNRIFGGSKSFPGAHPWQVSVQTRPIGASYEFSHMCGGILLTSCWVLTAAHCVEPTDEFQVVLGGVNIEKQEGMDQTIPVIQTIVHENYRDTPRALYNDIALLKLKVTDSPYCAKETRFVKTVCLPDQPFPAGKLCVISGWGATEKKAHSSQLLNAHVLLISEERCKASHVYGNLLDNSMLCAGTMNGGIDSCQGDSGGPLVCEQNGTHYITGVVSWGHGCGVKNKPGVYANVQTFLNWIKKMTA